MALRIALVEQQGGGPDRIEFRQFLGRPWRRSRLALGLLLGRLLLFLLQAFGNRLGFLLRLLLLLHLFLRLGLGRGRRRRFSGGGLDLLTLTHLEGRIVGRQRRLGYLFRERLCLFRPWRVPGAERDLGEFG